MMHKTHTKHLLPQGWALAMGVGWGWDGLWGREPRMGQRTWELKTGPPLWLCNWSHEEGGTEKAGDVPGLPVETYPVHTCILPITECT